MRIDGFSSQSYPLKRTSRKAAVRDEAIDDAEVIEEAKPPRRKPPPAALVVDCQPASRTWFSLAPVTAAPPPHWPAT